ncbi:MAG TPA: alpha/beta fold hydrolase [Egibacteraceae bacterium]
MTTGGTTTTEMMVRIGGQRLRVAVRPGRGQRPPLLLISGIGTSLEAFAPLVDALDPEREIIRFDVPGVGGSPTPALPYTIPSLALLVDCLVDALGHRRIDVLGTSWGGALAQQLALGHAHRVRRVVLANTGTGALMIPGAPDVLARLAAPAWLAAFDGEVPVSELLADPGPLFGGEIRDDPERAFALLGGPWLRVDRVGYAYQLAAGATWTSLPFLPCLRQPTLLLAGDDDPVVPLANAELMAALLPDARLHVYAGGHLGLATQPDELAPVIDAFLDAP